MKLTVIGCSGSMSGKHSAASSYLLQAPGIDESGIERTFSVILDLGPGAMGQSMNYVDPALLDGIVLSHLHADHCVDIVGMQVYRRWHPRGKMKQIPVVTPGNGLARTKAIAGDIDESDQIPEFKFVDVQPGDTAKLGPFSFEFFAALHTIEGLCVRVTGPSAADPTQQVVFTYSGDSDYCEGLVAAAQDADLFLCEAAFDATQEDVRGVHLTGGRAGTVASEANAKRLVLTHITPWANRESILAAAQEHYERLIDLAEPGLSIEF
ncbi:MAG: MBL fold metallo-hydrolase [Arcanobacterium sp.]|nr:MBL fold metallo-hydrolase [Arcanobacterium sp.]